MPRTKRQHYVPKFYLDRFVDDGGVIWNYEKGSGNAFALNTDDTAVETNFYSFRLDDGYFDGIENWLSGIEGLAAPLFEPLLQGNIPEREDRESFATFLAAQYARSPSFLRGYAETKAKLFDILARRSSSSWDQVNKVIDKIEKEEEIQYDEAERIALFEALQEDKQYEIHVSREAGLQAIEAANRLAPIFFEMTWHVVMIESGGIITGDNPVVRVVDPKTISRAYGDGGFANKSAFVTFPLSPIACLELTWAPTPEGKILSADRERVKLYNRQRAMFAEKRFYSDRQDAGLSRLARKYPNSAYGIDLGTEHESATVVIKRRIGK